MASMFKLDPATGDLVRENGRFTRIDGLEAVAQHVRVRLRLWREEVQLDQNKGMNYLGRLLTKGTPSVEIEGEITGQILDTPGVEEVTSLTSTFAAEDRRLSVEFRALVSLEDQRERVVLSDRITIVV